MASTNTPADIPLRIAVAVALFCSIASAVYVASEAEPTPIVSMFLWMGPLVAVAVWIQKDAHRTQVGAVHDLGWFIMLAWPIVIPWYAFRTRGRSGWRLLATLFALIFSAYVTALVTGWLSGHFAMPL